MAHHVTGLSIKCDEEGCPKTILIPNPDGAPFATLEWEAYNAGWFAHSHFGGPDLCPEHHLLRAKKVGAESLYFRPPDKNRPMATVGMPPARTKKEAVKPPSPTVLPGQIGFDGLTAPEPEPE